MNYFEILGLTPQFKIDEIALKKTFLLKSREVHPDFHTDKDEEEQEALLQQSSELNQAYEILKNKRSRQKYILELHGLLGKEKSEMPKDFLMEMMEFNEILMEIEINDDKHSSARLKQEAEQKLQFLEEESRQYEKAYDREESKEESLSYIKDLYLKQQYLHRILGNLGIM